MSRLIVCRDVPSLPGSVELAVGDLLIVNATGGRLQSHQQVLEILGPFVPGVVSDTGAILAPMGAPHTLALLAKTQGQERVEIMSGDPWHAPTTTSMTVKVA